jgi:hypothetical protein
MFIEYGSVVASGCLPNLGVFTKYGIAVETEPPYLSS